MYYLATLIILLLCAAGLGVGIILTKKPLKKQCSLEPNKDCTCDDEENPCENKSKSSKNQS